MPKPKNQRTPEEQKRVAEAAQFIQEREKLASQQGLSSKQAGREMIPAEDTRVLKQQQDMQKNLQEKALAELQPQQSAELNALQGKINDVLNPAVQPSTQQNIQPTNPGTPLPLALPAVPGEDKNQQLARTAGFVAAGSVAIAAPALLSSAGILTGALGKLKGVGALVGLGSVGAGIHALTSGRVSELEKNITTVTGHSRLVVADVKSGGDALQAINQLKDAESKVWALAGKLHVANGTDIIGKLRNKSEEEFLFAALDTITRRRQALERFVVTKNPAELDGIIGMELPQ